MNLFNEQKNQGNKPCDLTNILGWIGFTLVPFCISCRCVNVDTKMSLVEPHTLHGLGAMVDQRKRRTRG